MKIRALLLLPAVLCFLFSPTSRAASVPAPPAHRAATPFGIPLPATRDRAAWQQWRQQVQSRLEAQRTRLRVNTASGGSTGIIETIAGAAPFQKPVNALQTGFGQIKGVAEDSKGNLYIASCELGVVLKVDASSNTAVYAGMPLPTGPVADSGDGGLATAARISCPSGIALDTAGNLFVSNINEGTVRKVDAATGIIHTIAGIAGQRDHTGDGGPASAAKLLDPSGLALDGAGNLFIQDSGFVREVNLNTGIIETVAGPGSSCTVTASTTCPANSVGFAVVPSYAIAATPGHLYIAAELIGGLLSGGLLEVDLSSGATQLIAGGGPEAGTSPTYPLDGTRIVPSAIAADSAGNLYYSDTNKNQIWKYSSAGHTASLIAGNGNSGYTGDGGPATAATFDDEEGISLASGGKVLVVDDLRIRSFTVGGNITTIAGNGFANYFGDNGPGIQAGLDQPAAVVTDVQGNVYIADQLNGRVRRIDAVTGVITTIAGNGQFAHGGDSSALQTALSPFALALDQTRKLLYIRSYAVLLALDLETGALSKVYSGLSYQGGMVFDGDKTLYVSTSTPNDFLSNSRVLAIDIATGTATVTVNANNAVAPSGDGGPATEAGTSGTWGLALDGKGALFVAAEIDDNIRDVNLSTGIIETAAGHSTYEQPSYGGDGSQAIDAFLSYPTGLAYDSNGHLLFTDSGNDVVRQIELSNNIITTIAGNHVRGFGGDGGPADGAMLYFPTAITADPDGNLIVADTFNNRMRRILLHPTALNATLTDTQASDGSITFTATYSGLSFGFAPTGTVTFSSGGTSLGSGTLAPAADDSATFIATFTANSIPANGSTVTAQYSGDMHYAAGSKTLTFQQPAYTVSASPDSLTIQQGSSGSVAFTVTPQNGFHEQISFTCDASSLPRGVTCSFSPAFVTPSGSSAVTTTLTVQTTGASLASVHRPAGTPSGWLPRGGAMFALVIFLVPSARRKAWLGMAVVLLLFVSLGGCSGGGNVGGSGGSQNPNATPPGSYSIQVNSTAGSGQDTSPVTVSLIVKG